MRHAIKLMLNPSEIQIKLLDIFFDKNVIWIFSTCIQK